MKSRSADGPLGEGDLSPALKPLLSDYFGCCKTVLPLPREPCPKQTPHPESLPMNLRVDSLIIKSLHSAWFRGSKHEFLGRNLSPSARLRRTAARPEGDRKKNSLLAVRCSLSPGPLHEWRGDRNRGWRNAVSSALDPLHGTEREISSGAQCGAGAEMPLAKPGRLPSASQVS